MIKIWGRAAALNVQKVLWCADELGLDYSQIDAGQHHGVVDGPDYRALNPNGRIPTLEDGAFVLWESNVIVRYLAGKYGMGALCPTALAARADSDRWMDWQSTTVFYPTFRAYYLTIARTPPEQHDKKQLAETRVRLIDLFMILNDHLGGRPYVAGTVLTMGDIPIGCVIDKWMRMPIERPQMKNVDAYYHRLQQRPAYCARVSSLPYNAV